MRYKIKFRWVEDGIEDIIEVYGKKALDVEKKDFGERTDVEIINIEKCYKDGRLVDIV